MAKKDKCSSGKHAYPLQPNDWDYCPYCRLEWWEKQDIGKLEAVRYAARLVLSPYSFGDIVKSLASLARAIDESDRVKDVSPK